MLIGRTGVAFRAEGLDLLDLVVGLGRDVEELGRQAIDLLLQLAVAVEQILWPGEVELGVVLRNSLSSPATAADTDSSRAHPTMHWRLFIPIS